MNGGRFMNNIYDFNLITLQRKRKMANELLKKCEVNFPDISKRKKMEIELLVENILMDNFSPKESSVDIISLVKQDGFIVQTSEMDVNTTGCLIVNDLEPVMDTNAHRLIVVNKKLRNDNNDENYILKKSRFITAHEYGHFKMHKKPNQPIYAHRDTYHRTEPIELEADYFARSILMPYKIFNILAMSAWETSGNDKLTTIDILSKIFKTTKDKVYKRLCDLNDLQGVYN